MRDFNGNISLNIAEKGLNALWLRQRVISSNLANIDTPGYKARSVEFEDILKRAVNKKGEVSEHKLNTLAPRIRENTSSALREDGNNVDAGAENIELARLQIQYDFLSRAVSGELARMKYVIDEGKG